MTSRSKRAAALIDVNLGTATTVGEVINLINAASPQVVASLGTTGLILRDMTAPSMATMPFTVASMGDSTAAGDLGIDKAPIAHPSTSTTTSAAWPRSRPTAKSSSRRT